MTEISKFYFKQNENNNGSVEDNWNYIRDNLLKAINTYIPVKFISNSNNSPWMTSQLKRLISKKNGTTIKPKGLSNQLTGQSIKASKDR